MLSMLLLLSLAASPAAGVISVETSGVAPAAANAMKAQILADLDAAGVSAAEVPACADQACRHAALKQAGAEVMVSVGVLRAGPLAQVTVIVTGPGDPRAVERTLDSAKLEAAGGVIDDEVKAAVSAILGDGAATSAVPASDDSSVEQPPAVPVAADDPPAAEGAAPDETMPVETSLMAQLVLGSGFVLAAVAAGALLAGVATAVYSVIVIRDPGALSGDKELAVGGVLLGAGGAVVGVAAAAAAAGVLGWGTVLAWE